MEKQEATAHNGGDDQRRNGEVLATKRRKRLRAAGRLRWCRLIRPRKNRHRHLRNIGRKPSLLNGVA
jgi:hypothetical protein